MVGGLVEGFERAPTNACKKTWRLVNSEARDGVMPADLVLPVAGHHLAVLLVVAAVGEVELFKPQRQAEALRHHAQHAQPLGHHFLADAVAGQHCNPLHHLSPKNSVASASTSAGACSAM